MFILVFIFLYGSINFYLYHAAAKAYPNLNVFFATLLSLLALSLFAAILLERKKRIKLSLPFSWIGYTWLGVSGIALTFFAIGDLLQVFLPSFDNRIQFLITASLVGLASIWGGIEAKRYRTRRISITSSKLPLAEKPLRIVQISDLHLGDSSSIRFVNRLVCDINDLKPDIVVSTGDLFDGYLELMAPYVDLLREIEAPLGKFAVPGNHEVYAGLEKSMSLTELAGFTVLRNRFVELPQNLRIAGVEDPAGPVAPDENSILPDSASETFTMLLKHRPSVDQQSKGRFDLQLSGHTHGGQIAPFQIFTRLQYRLNPGLHEIIEGQRLYVSRGTGAWGPQIRLFAPPEISVFDLRLGGA